MMLGAVARGSVIGRRIRLASIAEKLLEILHGDGRMCRKDELRGRRGGDRDEILERIEAHPRVDMRADGEQAVMAVQERVAVWRRTRHVFTGDVAVRSRLALHDDGFSETLREDRR